ncbi:TIGR02757 family protein [bacterium]|nr:TIGR02757 family protein [bacterium]
MDTFRLLETAYEKHHSAFSLPRDPIFLVHGYQSKEDQEIAGFFSAILAYGNVRTILSSAGRVLRALGPSPAAALHREFPAELRSFKHRFTTGADIEIVFHWLRAAVQSHGSLETYFVPQPKGANTREILGDFVTRFTAQPLPSSLEGTRAQRARQLKYLLPHPERGSACKRLCMYLRWMVRPKDGIDLGLWTRMQPADLVLPIDTHLLKAVRALRWSRSKTANWKMAEKATARLREYCPQDPVRYDFALCHLSMEGGKVLQYRDTLCADGTTTHLPKKRAGKTSRRAPSTSSKRSTRRNASSKARA